MSSGWRAVAIAAGLAAATTAAYHGVLELGFVFDDATYVEGNRELQRGWTAEGLRWAFTSTRAANWHPLAWLSHMLDVRLFGLEPAGHHAVNLLLHVVGTVLLLFTLRAFTGLVWPSAIVAGIFALHPLHVETVAWVAERKDLLCALFSLLTLLAYRRYCARPGPARHVPVLAAAVAALLSKPMAVTLPCLLLLFDYWPLGRLRGAAPLRRAARLAAEKVPLFVLVAASSAITLHAQRLGGAFYAPENFGYQSRVVNALVAVATYLRKSFWPDPLAVYYPLPAAGYPWWHVGVGVVLLAGTSLTAVALGRRLPWLPVGWFWFAGMLVPVIGLVQVGMQAMADRYTYLPLVGLSVALVWTGRWVGAASPALRNVRMLAVTSLLVLLGIRTEHQVPVWRDNASLFGNAIAATSGNWVAHYFLAVSQARVGQFEEAAAQFREVLRLQPHHVEARTALADALTRLGRFDEAAANLRQSIALRPTDAAAHKNLGAALAAAGRADEAAASYGEAVRLEPGNAFYRALLEAARAQRGPAAGPGLASPPQSPAQARAQDLLRQGNERAAAGRLEEALSAYREALRLDPAPADAWNNLGSAYGNLGRLREAEEAFRTALRLTPGHAAARRNLGELLARRAGADSR